MAAGGSNQDPPKRDPEELPAADWEKIDHHFDALLDLAPEDHSAYLKELDPSRPELRQELERLLDADRRAHRFLAEPVDAAPDAPSALPLGSRVGQRLGPYRLLRLLGRGGMGEVWLAARSDDQYQQWVALKRLRRSSPEPLFLDRLRRERQILADLDHPGIGRLLDGGTDEAGQPYLVLQYVEGEAIDRYCDRHRLTIEQRLDLFREVCDAVHYAHRNLLVHRDLKPSNILVSAEGRPILLDFGIAKPIAADTTQTQTGLRMMTPAYASPEQLQGRPITTGSDIYSLGILLYLLLTGRHPFGEEPDRREAERRLSGEPPPAPSTAVMSGRLPSSDSSEDSEEDERISRQRGLRPAQLRRRLHGDLDQIVLKSLRLEPERRYASAEQLSDDLLRHLKGLPVRACRDRLSYRAGKFLRRHRWSAAAVTILSALLLASSIGLWTQRQSLIDERDTARQERQAAQEVSAFLEDLFEVADPYLEERSPLTARQALDRGAERLGSGLEDQPLVRARLQATMARVYGRMGQRASAQSLIEEAERTYRGLLSRDDPRLLRLLADHAELQLELQQYEAARTLAQEALSGFRAVAGEPSETIAGLLNTLGVAHRGTADFDLAESYFREALKIYLGLEGEGSLAVAEVLSNLAQLRRRRGDLSEAEALARRALAVRQARLPDDHPTLATQRGNLGLILLQSGKPRDASPYLLEAALSLRGTLGEDHHTTLMADGNWIGALLEEDRAEEALEPARDLVERRRRVFGPSHMQVCQSLFLLGRALVQSGRAAEAWDPLREAHRICAENLGPDHPTTGHANLWLARLDLEEGRPISAHQRAEKVYQVWASHFRSGNRKTRRARMMTALAAAARGDCRPLEEARAQGQGQGKGFSEGRPPTELEGWLEAGVARYAVQCRQL